MYRTASFLLVLATIVTLGALHPRSLAAAKLPVSISVDADEDSHLSEADRAQIFERLSTVWDLHRKNAEKAWACTQTPGQEDPLLAPLVPKRVRAEVRITRRSWLARLWGGDYDIEVRLIVEGQRNTEQQSFESVTSDEGDDQETHFRTVQELGSRAANKLSILLTQFSPCTVRTSMKLQGTLSAPDVDMMVTVQAEGELNLREDGTTEAAFPVAYRRTQTGACTLTTTATGRLQVSGGYRSDDGALALRMRLSLDPEAGTGTCSGGVQCVAGGGTITCTARGGSASQPNPGLELDLTPGDSVAVALADQASVALPRASGWPEHLSWDATLQLEYGAAGAGAGAVSSWTFAGSIP